MSCFSQITIGLAVAACLEYERDICLRLTVEERPLPPDDARVRRAGVHAKTRCSRQRGFQPPLKPPYPTAVYA